MKLINLQKSGWIKGIKKQPKHRDNVALTIEEVLRKQDKPKSSKGNEPLTIEEYHRRKK